MLTLAGTACAGSWHAAQQQVGEKEAPGNAAKVRANVAAWKALGDAGQAKVKDPMTVLYKDVEMEVSRPTANITAAHGHFGFFILQYASFKTSIGWTS